MSGRPTSAIDLWDVVTSLPSPVVALPGRLNDRYLHAAVGPDLRPADAVAVFLRIGTRWQWSSHGGLILGQVWARSRCPRCTRVNVFLVIADALTTVSWQRAAAMHEFDEAAGIDEGEGRADPR